MCIKRVGMLWKAVICIGISRYLGKKTKGSTTAAAPSIAMGTLAPEHHDSRMESPQTHEERCAQHWGPATDTMRHSSTWHSGGACSTATLTLTSTTTTDTILHTPSQSLGTYALWYTAHTAQQATGGGIGIVASNQSQSQASCSSLRLAAAALSPRSHPHSFLSRAHIHQHICAAEGTYIRHETVRYAGHDAAMRIYPLSHPTHEHPRIPTAAHMIHTHSKSGLWIGSG